MNKQINSKNGKQRGDRARVQAGADARLLPPGDPNGGEEAGSNRVTSSLSSQERKGSRA